MLQGFAGNGYQSIRGIVVDKSSAFPLIGAAIVLKQDQQILHSSISDVDGNYRLDDVPFGKYRMEVSFIGYELYVHNEVIVQAGNQTIINISLSESSFELAEIEVESSENRGDAINEYAIVSSRTFSIPETERYAGSRGEPSRMASNYAGVLGNNDNSNDIVVRGNTPIGLLWRLDGVNIPNPNHFAAGGSTGGPLTILNNQTLANSDFLTGAFPAEYGNTIAGSFDLQTRNGNNEEHEFSGELGFLGIKARAEGPLSGNKKSSYLLAYRYSTFAAFEAVNFNIGTASVPKYQDLNMKFNFPLKNNAVLSVFAIGGTSAIDLRPSENYDPESEVFADPRTDESFQTLMGTIGASYKKSINKNLFLRLTAYGSTEQSQNELIGLRWKEQSEGEYSVVEKQLMTDYSFRQDKSGLVVEFKQQIAPRHNLKYGIYYDHYRFDFADSTMNFPDSTYVTRLNHQGNGNLIQPYINWSWDVNEKLSLVSGLHGQFFDVSNSMSIEPRIGAKYLIDGKKWLEAGFGNHSQMLPTYTYFSYQFDENLNPSQNNINTDFLRSWHAVLGYNQMITPFLRLRLEAYHQWLYNIPVELVPSSYSILNEGGELERFFPSELTNTGDGRNYGFEFTLEKFFNNNYFLFLSGSFFSSTYRASDQNTYSTLFDAGHAVNLLGAKEWNWGTTRIKKLTLGGKFTFAGGRRYSPLDLEASEEAGFAVYDYTQRNQFQFDPYFRFDMNIKYRINAARFGHEFGLDLVNVFNLQNAFKLNYDPIQNKEVIEYQLGFLPIFYYRLDF